MDQIKVPLALVLCGYWLLKRLLLSRDSLHCKSMVERDVTAKHGCKEETTQLYALQ